MKTQAEEQAKAEAKEEERKRRDLPGRAKARERSQRKQDNHRRRLNQLLGEEKDKESRRNVAEGLAVTLALGKGIAWYTSMPEEHDSQPGGVGRAKI